MRNKTNIVKRLLIIQTCLYFNSVCNSLDQRHSKHYTVSAWRDIKGTLADIPNPGQTSQSGSTHFVLNVLLSKAKLVHMIRHN